MDFEIKTSFQLVNHFLAKLHEDGDVSAEEYSALAEKAKEIETKMLEADSKYDDKHGRSRADPDTSTPTDSEQEHKEGDNDEDWEDTNWNY